MAKGQSKTKRQHVTLSLRTLEYLEDLAGRGTHGDSIPDVAKSLIEQGVRNAIESGYIRLLDD